ncbi:DUF4124 domain-containing protein [Chitinibacter fontanus]|uniref:DUF4124 domain-containing protein n=1 Tax=Chitinibacter fontanus TaxID=1737446 RepID=A0A7D5V7U5_9NEIS|nr:DUF4124 domain-containing protein [Chitinibacter fontanus]QLI80234.1 DUF4124 domain-containing protein [Chitinibacter fontanus]
MFEKTLFTLLFATTSALCWADIYKYVDENGNVTFTNSPIKGAVRIMAEPSSPRRSTSETSGKATQPRAPSVAAPSPINFPRVDAATQKSRDSNRKQILTDELNSEQASLNAAKKALQEADANRSAEEKANPKLYLDRIGRLRETIVMHEKNTAALQAELSRMR